MDSRLIQNYKTFIGQGGLQSGRILGVGYYAYQNVQGETFGT